MFHKENLQCLDPDYFVIIHMDDYDVTVMSKNTGHVWYIHNPEYPLPGSCVIFLSIRLPIPIISMDGAIPCGRR